MSEANIWGDIPTWIAAIAAVVAAVGTISAVRTSLGQIDEERKLRVRRERDAEEQQKRDQAEHVSAWVAKETRGEGYKAWIAVLNQSSQPVYEVVVSIVNVKGRTVNEANHTPSEYRSPLSVVPPGRLYTSVPATYHGMSFHPGIEIAFRDILGRNWLRKADGTLRAMEEMPLDHYGIDRPVSWRLPEQEVPTD